MLTSAVGAAMSVALYIGLNSALQRRVDLDRLALGSVNRARSSTSGVGGKGQGAFLAASRLATATAAAGVDTPQPRLCMFLGAGREGDTLAEKLLERTEGTWEPHLWVRVSSPCRICTTLVESETGDATEIIEPTGAVAAGEWETLLEALGEVGVEDRHGCGVASLGILGTMPPGVPTDAYSQIIRRTCGPHTRVLIDSVVNVHQTLHAAVKATAGSGATSSGGGVMLKLNAREILKLAGAEMKGSDSKVAADPFAVAAACRQISAAVATEGEHGVDYICFTDGPFPGGVIAVNTGRVWKLKRTQPLRDCVVSPIGAGDATSAGTLHAWCQRQPNADPDVQAMEAFRFGLAVGAASCLTGENANFNMADVDHILGSIVASEVR